MKHTKIAYDPRQPLPKKVVTYPPIKTLPGDTPNVTINRFACPRCGAIGEQTPTGVLQQERMTLQTVADKYMAVPILCSHCGNRYKMVQWPITSREQPAQVPLQEG